MTRPRFENPLGTLGEGLAGAAQQVAGFFNQRAQYQYQEGVATIAEADQKLQELTEVESNPYLKPEEIAVLNDYRQYWNDVKKMPPMEARAFTQKNPPPDVRQLIQARRPPRESAGTRQGGQQHAGAGQGQAPRAAQYDEQDPRQYLSSLRRQAGRREIEDVRSREDQVAVRDFSLDRILNQDQIDAGVTMEQLRHANNLEMQEGEHAQQEYLRNLEHRLGLQEMSLDNAYQTARDERLFEQQLSVQDRGAYFDRVRAARDAHANGDPVGTAELEALAGDPAAPEGVREQARAALGADTSMARDAYRASLQNIVNQEEISAAEASVAPELASMSVDEAEKRLGLMDQELVVGGQRIQLNSLDVRGRELANQRAEFELTADQFTNAVDYVNQSVNLGMPDRIQMLLDVKNSGDESHPLWHLASQVTTTELQESLGVAEQVGNLEQRNMELADAQIDEALDNIQVGQLQNRAALLQSLSAVYGPEQIMSLPENDPRVRALMSEGLLTQNDLRAAANRSSFNRAVEQNEVNGPRLNTVMTTLDRYASMPVDPNDPAAMDAATSAVASSLQTLVDMGYMSPEGMQGTIEMYRRGWSQQDEAFNLDLAMTRTQMSVMERELALRVRDQDFREGEAARKAGEGDGLSAADVNAYVGAYETGLEAIVRANPHCFTDDVLNAEMVAGASCGMAHQSYRQIQQDLMTTVFTLTGRESDPEAASQSAVQNAPDITGDPQLDAILYLSNQKEAAVLRPGEAAALELLTEAQGGVDEVERRVNEALSGGDSESGGGGPSWLENFIERGRVEPGRLDPEEPEPEGDSGAVLPADGGSRVQAAQVPEAPGVGGGGFFAERVGARAAGEPQVQVGGAGVSGAGPARVQAVSVPGSPGVPSAPSPDQVRRGQGGEARVNGVSLSVSQPVRAAVRQEFTGGTTSAQREVIAQAASEAGYSPDDEVDRALFTRQVHESGQVVPRPTLVQSYAQDALSAGGNLAALDQTAQHVLRLEAQAAGVNPGNRTALMGLLQRLAGGR